MIFDVQKSNNKKIKGMYIKAMEELRRFFEIDWNQNEPKIFLVKDRKIFDEFSEGKTEEWVIATALISTDIIIIFSPERVEKETIHKYSDDFYYKIIKHELAHRFTHILRKANNCHWLTEGLAVYVSGQIDERVKPKEFCNFLSYFDEADSKIYAESPFAVEILIKQFGKKKFLEFLKVSDTENEKEFKKIFKDFFGIELGYEWFNKMLKES